MKKILFVCTENSNRSQMAQAFAKIHGSNLVEAYSAGSKPSGEVNPKAIESMKELGYDLTTHHSKSLQDIPQEEFEHVITMGCGDECPWIPSKNTEDWDIPDPKDMPVEEFRKVRDLVRDRVRKLLADI